MQFQTQLALLLYINLTDALFSQKQVWNTHIWLNGLTMSIVYTSQEVHCVHFTEYKKV